MKEKIQLLAAALALILLLCGCAARGTASNDAKPAAGDVTDSNAAPYEVPAFRDSVFNEEEATAFGSGEIDLSQLEGGIIGVKAQSDTRLKIQIVCGEDKYNYDLPNDGTATFFPLNMGDGTYTVIAGRQLLCTACRKPCSVSWINHTKRNQRLYEKTAFLFYLSLSGRSDCRKYCNYGNSVRYNL